MQKFPECDILCSFAQRRMIFGSKGNIAMTMEAWGQIVGIVATLIITSAYQANTKKGLLMIQSPGIAVLCVSYLLLGATSVFVPARNAS